MAAKLRWFKFFPGDWALSTQGMTPTAKGLYIDLLCMQWAGRRLPAAYADLSAMMPTMSEAVYRELLQHFDAVDGWLVNRRLEDERHDAERRSDNGQRGAAAKWDRNAPAMQEQCSTNAPPMLQQCHRDTETDTEAEAETETETEADGDKKRKRRTATVTWDFESGFAGIPESDLAEWADAYGKIDVPEQVKQAHQHLRTHPEKRYRNYRRYLGDWMARAQRYAEERIAKVEAAEAARARGSVRDRSHMPADVHPDDEFLFWTPDGKPRMPPVWRRKDGSWNQ